MKKRWRIQRSLLATPDGQQRWDRAYQALLGWAEQAMVVSVVTCDQGTTEAQHASSGLCARVDPATGPSADD